MQKYPHRIRLRGPWEATALAGEQPLPDARRMKMPCRWREQGWEGFSGRAQFVRRFGYPGRLDTNERVWLTFGGIAGSAQVWLNHEELPFREEIEISSRLQPRNELKVEINGDENGGLHGEVALEIRRTAFLRQVQAYCELIDGAWRCHAEGTVVGSAERALDLYVVVDRHSVAYVVLEPSEAGAPFRVVEPIPISPDQFPRMIRIELVDGGNTWYQWEVPIASESSRSEL